MLRSGTSRITLIIVTLLPEPGLADDPEHLVGAERERDAVDRGHLAAVGEEGHAQVADVEQRLAHAVTASRVRGSSRA